MTRRLAGLCLLLFLMAAGVSACGTDDGVEETRIIGDSLTVYSSLPLHGPLAPVARDMVAAEKLALQEAGGRAGLYAVNYVSLDASDPETGRWSPGRVSGNARRAVQTPNAIAYLGELEPGASATSVPILNEGGILQVSPRDTYAGLTEPVAPGEPDRWYPSGERTFTRVVPPGTAQVDELVPAMRAGAVRRLTIVDDGALPTGLGDAVAEQAREAGITITGRRRVDAARGVPEGLAAQLRGERPDALFYGGGDAELAADVFRAAGEADRRMRLYGSDALALAPALSRRAGAAADRLVVTGVDPGASGDFARRFRAAFGREPHPQAVLGHRAMQLVLDAVRRAGKDADSRLAVIERAVAASGEPRAGFAQYRLNARGLVRVGSAM